MLLESSLTYELYWDIVRNGLNGFVRRKVFLPFSGKKLLISEICNVRLGRGCQFKPTEGNTRFFTGFLAKEECEIVNGNRKIEESFKKDPWSANSSIFMDLKDIYKNILLGRRLLFLPISGRKIRTGCCKGCGSRGVYYRYTQPLCAYDFAFIVWFGMSVFLKRNQKHCVFCMPNFESRYLIIEKERQYKMLSHGAMIETMGLFGPIFSKEVETFFGPVLTKGHKALLKVN